MLQERNLETAALGLAPMYPAYLWSVSTAPGHHGYERASDLISGESLDGLFGSQFSVAPGRPVLHRVVHALADLGGKTWLCWHGHVLHPFPCSVRSAFPRPGHALPKRRRAQGLSRRAVRPPRSGLVLIVPSTVPGSGRLGRMLMADLEITAVMEHGPGDAGELVGKSNGKLVVRKPLGRGLDPALEAVTLPAYPL